MENSLPYLNAHPEGTVIVENSEDLFSVQEVSGTRAEIETLQVRKGEGKELMPDLTGLPMRSALSQIEGKGLIIKVSGNGRVIEQIRGQGHD